MRSAPTKSWKKKSPRFSAIILLARYPELLTARYGFALEGMDGAGLIEAVARRRGCQLKGGGLDLEKAALILLRRLSQRHARAHQPRNAADSTRDGIERKRQD